MAANRSTDDQKLIVVGVLRGAHGVRGDVRVQSFTAEPEDCFAYGPLLDEKGGALLEAVSARPAKDHFIVRPKTLRQKEEWDALKGVKLYVPRDAFEAPEDDEFYIEDLVGLAAVSPEGASVGRVKAVQNYGAGDLLEIAPMAGGKSVFVPFTEAAVPDVDLEAGRIVILEFDAWADESAGEA